MSWSASSFYKIQKRQSTDFILIATLKTYQNNQESDLVSANTYMCETCMETILMIWEPDHIKQFVEENALTETPTEGNAVQAKTMEGF